MDVKNQSEVNPIEQKHGAQVSPELNKTNQKADLKNILASKLKGALTPWKLWPRARRSKPGF